MDYEEIKKELEQKGQVQLLKYYDELDEAGKEDHREEDMEAFERKLVVQLAFLAEEVDY